MVVQCKHCKHFDWTGVGQDGKPNPCGGICMITGQSAHEGVDACKLYAADLECARKIVEEANAIMKHNMNVRKEFNK